MLWMFVLKGEYERRYSLRRRVYICEGCRHYCRCFKCFGTGPLA